MPTRNVSDLQLWWSHPNYTPHFNDRVRNLTTKLTAGGTAGASAGAVFQMDSSFPDIDDFTLPSFIGEVFRIKEHMGIGQNRPRRTFVNVRDVKEASGTFTCNFGANDTPEQFFKAVRDDPGADGDGQKRPLKLYGVINPNLAYEDTTGTAAVDLAAGYSAGATTIHVDTVAAAALTVGTFIKFNGHDTVYEVVGGSLNISVEGDITIAPGLTASVANDVVITQQARVPNLDTPKDANVSDYVLAEFDYTPEVDGELMGAFTLQAAGTGYQNLRDED